MNILVFPRFNAKKEISYAFI